MRSNDILNSELIIRIRENDSYAFELLFKLYHKPLIHFARVYLKRLELAEEVVQETFIKVWEARSSLDETKSIKAFLYRCVHNNSINLIKKRKIDGLLTIELQKELHTRLGILSLDVQDDYFDHLELGELEDAIERAIEKLPSQCKEVFMLSRFKEMTYQQIATHLSISINTVKTQLSRAFQKLAADIK